MDYWLFRYRNMENGSFSFCKNIYFTIREFQDHCIMWALNPLPPMILREQHDFRKGNLFRLHYGYLIPSSAV